MNKKIGEAIWKWVLLLLLPPITLIIAVEFGKVFYQMGSVWGVILIVVFGIVAEIIEIMTLINETKKVFEL